MKKVSFRINLIILFMTTAMLILLTTTAYACPACVDSGTLFFFPFLKYWYYLLIFWLIFRFIFQLIGKKQNTSQSKLPGISFVFWGFLFFLSFGTMMAGGLFFLLIFFIFPSWLISYITCLKKIWKIRKENKLYQSFINFQITTLILFVLIIPLSYIIPRKVPYNVRIVDRKDSSSRTHSSALTDEHQKDNIVND